MFKGTTSGIKENNKQKQARTICNIFLTELKNLGRKGTLGGIFWQFKQASEKLE